ncbi:efflux RND transporter periplasmic adaptor subunit [Marinicella sediminis]|uniref:Efflux RND transporter periplasmic adaptor subunit n=1 Tax=Marinicella sediminis TaxID=1792834 RepID=A0ABV7JG51_9GAMM|nr:HlyD family efflux transporter periplasmic adaptor subunit [Marinicella sediminis]
MDIELSPKKSASYKKYIYVAVSAVILFFIVKYLVFLGQSDFSVDEESLTVAEVKSGKFTVMVRGSGVLVPDNIRWLSAGVEGKVERNLVKAGDVVKKGDLIIELHNQEIKDLQAETEWELEAMMEEVNAGKIADETAMISQENTADNNKLEFERTVTEYEARKKLVKTGAVSELDFQRSRVVMEQAEQRWVASTKLVEKMRENNKAQAKMRLANLEQTKKRLDRIKRQVRDLEVRASFDSIVLDVPLEIGERVNVGANVAKLAQQDSLIAELQIPEIQIREVVIGQKVLIDTRNSEFFGIISRIDPAVINGNVKVDVSFTDPLPSDVRPDMSVDGEIKIAEIEQTLFVQRPLFSQSLSASSVYKLMESGLAERIQVEWGLGSVNQIQVENGLRQGDKIIVSDPSRFDGYDKFRIN